MPSILGAQGQHPTVRRAVAFLTNVHVLLRHERNRSWPARIRTDDDQVRPNLGVARCAVPYYQAHQAIGRALQPPAPPRWQSDLCAGKRLSCSKYPTRYVLGGL